jgi:hypothetical protein
MALHDVLAVNNFGDTESGGLAGPMGLLVVVLMCIATVLLVRNMNKRLRQLPDSFRKPQQTQREAEIALSAADPGHPESDTGARNVETDRSATAGTAEETEVKAVGTQSDGPSVDGDSGRI